MFFRTFSALVAQIFSSHSAYSILLRRLIPAVILFALIVIPAMQVNAVDILVTDAASLQAAVSTATASDTIILQNSITLDGSITTFPGNGTNAMPVITTGRTVNIEGQGFSITRTGGAFRFFDVNVGGKLTLTDVTLVNGIANGGASPANEGGAIYNVGAVVLNNAKFSGNASTRNGGAIYNTGTLTADLAQFNNNTAPGGGVNPTNIWDGGGAIYNTGGTMTIRQSRFINNTFSNGSQLGGGAAIANLSSASSNGSATIIGSTFDGNVSANSGGAIFNVRGNNGGSTSMTIEGSTFNNNTALAGGAVYNTEIGTSADITRSVFTNNSATAGSGFADRGGGALYNRNTMTVSESRIENNSAGFRGGAIINFEVSGGQQANLTMSDTLIANNNVSGAGGVGGALWNRQRTDVTFTNVTITGNNATNGGGIYNERTSSIPNVITLNNVTLANNTGTTGSQIYANENTGDRIIATRTIISGAASNCFFTNVAGINDTSSQSLSSDASCDVVPNSASLNLGALTDNGGFSRTIALGIGSTAIDLGTSGCPGADQRGVARPGTCDSGAFEASTIVPATVSFTVSPVTITEGATTATVTVTVDNTASGAAVGIDAFFVVSGTAALNADYADGGLSNGSFTINAGAGATNTRSFTINPLVDTITDGGETITLNLDFSGFGTFSGSNNQTVTIQDAVPPATGSVIIAPATFNIIEGNNGTYTVSVDTTPDPGETVTVTLTPDNPALATLSATTVTFTAADFAARTITVTPTDDSVDTGARVLTISHAVSTTGGAFDTATGGNVTVNITDDDAPIVIVPGPLPGLDIFDPAISKLGFLAPGQTGVNGERVEWVVTVSNIGLQTGENVVIRDDINPGLRIVRVDSEFGTVSRSGQTVEVTFATLQPGETVQFTIVTDVLDGKTVNNVACVTASNYDSERCSDATVLGALPQTGETPLWASLLRGLMLSLGTIGLGLVLVIPAAKVARR